MVLVGVSKPDKLVYLEAAKRIFSHPSFGDLEVDFSTSEKELESLETAIGPYWVHVGDDFVKDVVAAKSLKMRSIWLPN